MKRLILFILVTLLALMFVPTIGAHAQGTTPQEPTIPQVYLWLTVGAYLLTLVAVGVAAFALGHANGLKQAIGVARNDIVGMNKLEDGLVNILKPSGTDALNFALNAGFTLLGPILAAKVDPEVLAALKDYANSVTDRKPNLPPVPPAAG